MQKCPLTDRDGFHELWKMQSYGGANWTTIYTCPLCLIKITQYQDGTLDIELPKPKPEPVGELKPPETTFNDWRQNRSRTRTKERT